MESGNKYVMTVSKKLMEAVGIEDGNTYYAYYQDGLLYIKGSCEEAEEAAYDDGFKEGFHKGARAGFTGGYRLGFSDAVEGEDYDETYHDICGVDCDGDCDDCRINRNR